MHDQELAGIIERNLENPDCRKLVAEIVRLKQALFTAHTTKEGSLFCAIKKYSVPWLSQVICSWAMNILSKGWVDRQDVFEVAINKKTITEATDNGIAEIVPGSGSEYVGLTNALCDEMLRDAVKDKEESVRIGILSLAPSDRAQDVEKEDWMMREFNRLIQEARREASIDIHSEDGRKLFLRICEKHGIKPPMRLDADEPLMAGKILE